LPIETPLSVAFGVGEHDGHRERFFFCCPSTESPLVHPVSFSLRGLLKKNRKVSYRAWKLGRGLRVRTGRSVLSPPFFLVAPFHLGFFCTRCEVWAFFFMSLGMTCFFCVFFLFFLGSSGWFWGGSAGLVFFSPQLEQPVPSSTKLDGLFLSCGGPPYCGDVGCWSRFR